MAAEEHPSKSPASLVPAAVVSRLAAAQKATHIQLVPANDAVRAHLGYMLRAAFEHPDKLHPADAATAHEINRILDGLKYKAPAAVPQGTRMAAEISVYVLDAQSPGVFAMTVPWGESHVILGLVITSETLKKSKEKTFKIPVAHELAHHLFDMNPALREDPRFQPHSKQFKTEMDRLDFAPREEEIQKVREQAERNDDFFTRGDRAEYIAMKIKERKNNYIGELQMDKLSLWLSGDVETTRFVFQHLKEGAQASSVDDDACPSAAVREAEILATAADIRKAERAKTSPHAQRQR